VNVNQYNRGNGRQPDFIVKVGVRGEKWHRRVGAAWRVKGDGIAIKIDAGIALVGAHDISITMWPAEEQRQPQTSNQQHPWGD
jgi:hypothetical protein